MVKGTKLVRMRIEDYNKLEQKKALMESRIKAWTGKNVKIPFSQLMKTIANSPVEIHEKKIIHLSKMKFRSVKK